MKDRRITYSISDPENTIVSDKRERRRKRKGRRSKMGKIRIWEIKIFGSRGDEEDEAKRSGIR